MLFGALTQNRDDTLQLNKLLEFVNFGGAICLDFADQVKKCDIKMIDTSYEIDFSVSYCTFVVN